MTAFAFCRIAELMNAKVLGASLLGSIALEDFMNMGECNSIGFEKKSKRGKGII
jgi:hypothetical protein